MSTRVIQALMLLAMAGSNAPALSQVIDNCMLADGNEAISRCTELLDSGNRSADVYYKLSSELYELKRIDESRATIDKALDLHPGNSKLVTLREAIDSNQTESERLAQSAVRNASSLDRGRAKITCLAQRSIEALSACRRHLELTSEDRDRILARIAVLEQEFGGTDDVDRDEVQTALVEPVPGEPASDQAALNDTPIANPEPVEPPVADQQAPQDSLVASNVIQNARAERYRAAVRRVQQLLNDLSFPAGLPDGLPGSQTRSALDSFYQRTGLPRRVDFDAETINALQEQKDKLETAEGLLAMSRLTAEKGDLDSAVTQLQRAGNISRLLDIPIGYREELDTRLAARDALFEPAAQRADAELSEDSIVAEDLARRGEYVADSNVLSELPLLEPDQSSRTVDVVTAPSSSSDAPAKVAPVNPGNAEFDILMRQIATLEQQLESRQNAFDVQWQKVRATALVVMNRYW